MRSQGGVVVRSLMIVIVLAIVAAVAGAHGGRAWAAPGPGGHFRLMLPAAAPVVLSE